jgi:hypothetical protein
MFEVYDLGTDPEMALNEKLKKFLDRQSLLSAKLEDMNIEALALLAEMRYLENLVGECMEEKKLMRIEKMNARLGVSDKMSDPAKKIVPPADL